MNQVELAALSMILTSLQESTMVIMDDSKVQATWNGRQSPYKSHQKVEFLRSERNEGSGLLVYNTRYAIVISWNEPLEADRREVVAKCDNTHFDSNNMAYSKVRREAQRHQVPGSMVKKILDQAKHMGLEAPYGDLLWVTFPVKALRGFDEVGKPIYDELPEVV